MLLSICMFTTPNHATGAKHAGDLKRECGGATGSE
jgi:hypothetical protein